MPADYWDSGVRKFGHVEDDEEDWTYQSRESADSWPVSNNVPRIESARADALEHEDSSARKFDHRDAGEEFETVGRVARADGHYVAAPEPPQESPPPPTSEVVSTDATPGMVVVPAFPFDTDEGARMFVELWERPNDVTLAVGYSSQRKLVEQLGSDQPWALLSTEQFQGLLQTGKVTALLLDPAPGAVTTRWSRAATSALAAMRQGGR